MHLLHAVRGPLPLEAVPLHDARGATALGRAGDVDRLDPLEKIDREHLADLGPVEHAPQLPDEPLRLAVGLGNWGNAGFRQPLGPLALELCDLATNRATGETAGLVEKAQLDGRVAIPLDGPHDHYRTGPRLDDGDGHRSAIGVEDLRHADLAAEQALTAGKTDSSGGGR